MNKLLLPERLNTRLGSSQETAQEIALDHACLVTEYMSYMAAAGYSVKPQAVTNRSRGAWKFLTRFPDPGIWLTLPVDEQLRCLLQERNFVHYLFLRRLLAMPPAYMLVARHCISDMGRRLMERETYEHYRKMACQLGYRDFGIKRQFQSLLCLMAWAQRPMDSLALADLDAFTDDLKSAYQGLDSKWQKLSVRDRLPSAWYCQLLGVRNVLYHLGIFPQMTRSRRRELTFEKQWQQIPCDITDLARRYIRQVALSFYPSTAKMERFRLYRFFSWLAKTMPEVTSVSQLKRRHIEAFKEYLRWVPPHPRLHRPPGSTLSSATRYKALSALHHFLERIIEWQWPEAPDRPLMFDQDLPPLEQPLPRFLEEVKAAQFLEAARNYPELFARVCGVTLMLTGLRKSEFLNLTTDCVVLIGDGHWLHVPLGKTHRDRFIPLHPEVKQLLNEWTAKHPPEKPYDFIFTRYGRRIGCGKVDLTVKHIAEEAGIPGRVTPHRLRHTLATLAINRGMPLENIAAILGHRTLAMTLVYARIGNRTVQQEYSAVSHQLEQLCNRAQTAEAKEDSTVAPIPEGAQMRRLRQEHWRMLGNGYCTRPEGVRCEYETICETCPCFSTTIDFLPVLHKQRQDAEDKGQELRVQTFARLIKSMEQANENICHPLLFPGQSNRMRKSGLTHKNGGNSDATDKEKVKCNFGKPEG